MSSLDCARVETLFRNLIVYFARGTICDLILFTLWNTLRKYYIQRSSATISMRMLTFIPQCFHHLSFELESIREIMRNSTFANPFESILNVHTYDL